MTVQFSIHQIEKRKYSSECIPEAIISKHIPGKHFSIVWAIVYDLIIFIDLIKFTGKQQYSVQTGIKSPDLLVGASTDMDSAQFMILNRSSFIPDRLETFLA